MRPRRVHEKILDGSRNVRFEDVCRLAEAFGFQRDRVSGSHHIYRHAQGLMLNLQPDRNGQAKFYQVRQLLELVEQNGLRLRD
jgi:hypothetical protein